MFQPSTSIISSCNSSDWSHEQRRQSASPGGSPSPGQKPLFPPMFPRDALQALAQPHGASALLGCEGQRLQPPIHPQTDSDTVDSSPAPYKTACVHASQNL